MQTVHDRLELLVLPLENCHEEVMGQSRNFEGCRIARNWIRNLACVKEFGIPRSTKCYCFQNYISSFFDLSAQQHRTHEDSRTGFPSSANGENETEGAEDDAEVEGQ